MAEATAGRHGDVLVLGAGGTLGSAFVAAMADRPPATAGRTRLRDASSADLMDLLVESGARLVVNCAADVDAEGAERDNTVAVAANAVLPRRLALACAQRGVPLIQFSSTGCYGDWQTDPYVETDPLRPTTQHHRSKAMGEDGVRDANGQHLIVRTGWLYGGVPGRPRNFVWQRLVEASRTAEMLSDGHQRGCPTDVAAVTRQVIVAFDAGVRGTINVVAHGVATRADYVAEIVNAACLPCRVRSGPAFARLAPVSSNETAINARLLEHGVDIMPRWQESIRGYVGELMRLPPGFSLKD